MFGRKLKNQISKLKAQITLLTIDKEAIEKASNEMAAKYRDDLMRLDEVRAENAELKKQIEELKLKISRKGQKRGADGRFAKKGSTTFKPNDGDIIAIDMDNILCRKSVLVGILRGKLGTGNEGFPVYAGLDLNENLEIDGTFGCHHEARPATKKEKEKLLSALKKEGLKWNSETKTLNEIGKKEFKIGDKVRIKEGVSSKTHHLQNPCFLPEMDSCIDKVGVVTKKPNSWAIRVDFDLGRLRLYNYHPEWLEHVE